MDQKWFDLFDKKYKSGAVSVILSAIRSGAKSVDAVKQGMKKVLEERDKKREKYKEFGWYADDGNSFYFVRKHIADSSLSGTIEYYLWYESLSEIEKEKMKADKTKEGIRLWMAKQPATEKQKSYLKSLGVSFNEDISKLSASELIDKNI